MFKHYHPNVKAVIQFLKLLNVKVSNVSVNETLQNHPDWPALLCISDGLTEWNVPNGAGKIDPDDIDQLPVPFMAHFSGEEPPLCIVTEVNTEQVTLYARKYKEAETISRTEFLQRWSGIYLLTEPGEHSGENGYQWKKAKAFLSSLFTFGIPAMLAIAAIFLSAATWSAPAVLIQYYILLSGIFVTSLLLWHEIDSRNPILQKVCSSIKQGNCSAILSSKGAKLFSWLSWSEVGFFYFTGGALSLLFVKDAIIFVTAVNLLALPYIFYSVYYQGRIAKQWCILCLLVQALLLLGGINIAGSGLYGSLEYISMPVIVSSVIMYLVPAYVWAVAKPLLLNRQQFSHMKREFLRIKFNTDAFTAIINNGKVLRTATTEGIGIVLGDPGATNEIIKVCNPYCGACIKTHPMVEQLLENTPNVKVKIIFRTSQAPADPSINVVKHFLAIAAENNKDKTKRALDAWYLSNSYDYANFSKQFAVNGQLEKQTARWEEMNKWCKASDITFTPTFFVNGRQLPDVYNIEDMQYFLLE